MISSRPSPRQITIGRASPRVSRRAGRTGRRHQGRGAPVPRAGRDEQSAPRPARARRRQATDRAGQGRHESGRSDGRQVPGAGTAAPRRCAGECWPRYCRPAGRRSEPLRPASRTATRATSVPAEVSAVTAPHGLLLDPGLRARGRTGERIGPCRRSGRRRRAAVTPTSHRPTVRRQTIVMRRSSPGAAPGATPGATPRCSPRRRLRRLLGPRHTGRPPHPGQDCPARATPPWSSLARLVVTTGHAPPPSGRCTWW